MADLGLERYTRLQWKWNACPMLRHPRQFSSAQDRPFSDYSSAEANYRVRQGGGLRAHAEWICADPN